MTAMSCEVLRRFRDEYLMATEEGRALVESTTRLRRRSRNALSGKRKLEGVLDTVRRSSKPSNADSSRKRFDCIGRW